MSYICFNTDCDRWGEAVTGVAILAVWPAPGHLTCLGCGGVAPWHDNWQRDQRTPEELEVEIARGFVTPPESS